MTALGVFASTGMAAACQTQSTTTPFASPQFGSDLNGYFLAPGASFEGQQTSWTTQGAGLTAGNEPFYVNSPTDSQSMTIGTGGSATSPSFCLDSTMPTFRFFAKQVSAGSDLQVTLQFQNGGGAHYIAPLADLGDGSTPNWTATGALALNTGLIPLGQQGNAQLKFSVPQGSGSWQIDDVYIDPYRA